jgi:hypothetical protein
LSFSVEQLSCITKAAEIKVPADNSADILISTNLVYFIMALHVEIYPSEVCQSY